MDSQFKIVYEAGTSEVIVKKSRFIASVSSVDTEEDANEFIQSIKKKYWDASHNCFAYIIGEDHNIQRFSDDREPSGTAGKPILDIILGQSIHNVVIVVTRYFGGTLLGTGGLCRAYSKAAREGLDSSTIIEKMLGSKLELILDYNSVSKVQYIISQLKITTVSSDYSEVVKLTVIIIEDKMESFKKKITEATSGNIEIIDLGRIYFAMVKEEVIVF